LAPSRKITNRQAANALLRGYRKGLDDPRPALLFENKAWLRPDAEPAKGEPEKFWKKVAKYPAHKLPAVIEKTLRARLPKGVNPKSIRRCRILRKGAGSLGRPRYAVVADWDGGQVLREAKALIPSAWTWARNPTASGRSHLITLAKGPHRAPDPSLDVQKKFVFRRIAGDSRKIELGKNAGKKLHLDLLEAMGFDIASIHAAGSVGIDRLKEDLDSRPRSWLNDAATTAAEEVRRDYREWRS
jgi:hypothetical protein